MKKYNLVLLCCLMLFGAIGCKTIKTTTGGTTTTTTTTTTTDKKDTVAVVKTEPKVDTIIEPIITTTTTASPMNPNLPMPVSTPESPIVVLETEYGNLEIQLFDKTPQHRDNFIKLVKEGYYDGTLFHRVIKKFMIQGGDPNSKNATAGQMLGTGGPGYTVPAEFVREYIHIKGALAAARQGDQVNPTRSSSGSQFYIVQGASVQANMLDMMQQRGMLTYTAEERELYQTVGGTPHLDTQYTVFGRVISGMEIIDKIAAEPTLPGDRPVKDIKIKMYLK